MKTTDASIITLSLWEYHNIIATRYRIANVSTQLLHRPIEFQESCQPEDTIDYWVFPDLSTNHYYHVGVKSQHIYGIEDRLVIAYHDASSAEVLAIFVGDHRPYSIDMVNVDTHCLVNYFVHYTLAAQIADRNKS